MKKYFLIFITVLLSIVGLAGCATKVASTNASKPVQLSYYYPVGVSGPLATVMTNMVNQFNQTHPDIQVNPVFSGTYPQTLAKVETSIQGGNPPDVVVLNHTARLDLIHLNAIEPLDDLVKQGNYYPAFTEPPVNGHYWGVPFQRSTVVLYYNKDAFKKAGLDPSHGPETWNDLVADGQALEKSGITGIEIPSDGTVYWQFEPFVTDGGKNLGGDDGKTVNFNSQAAKDALNFWLDLSHKYKVEPVGILPWATTPDDFANGHTAMIIHSSGSLANILKKSSFDVGVAFLPKNKSEQRTGTGGGDLYLLKGLAQDHRDAALTFIKWMTTPEQQASWSINTGYVASTPKAYDLQVMKDFAAKTPQALVSPQQLQYAQPEMSTYQLNQVYDVANSAIQSVVAGKATVDDALNKAQQDADNILKPYQQS